MFLLVCRGHPLPLISTLFDVTCPGSVFRIAATTIQNSLPLSSQPQSPDYFLKHLKSNVRNLRLTISSSLPSASYASGLND